MLRAIIRKECQYHLAGFRFRVGAFLAILLAASSALIAARDYDLRLRTWREQVAEHARALSRASVYSYLQPVVVRPPEPLSILDQGFDAHLGTEVVIHVYTVPAVAVGGHRGNELLVGVPALDLTTIVTVVLGLLALLLAGDSVTCERENGMLRAVLAQGVRRSPLLIGKILGGILTLALPLGGALLVSLAILRFATTAELTAGHWLRIAALTVVYVAYLCLMFLVGLVVSLGRRSPSTALTASVIVWLTFILLLPGAVWATAEDLAGIREGQRAARAQQERMAARHEERLAAELRSEPLLATFSGHTAVNFSGRAHGAVRYRHGSAAYYDALSDYFRFEVREGMRYAGEVFAVQQQIQARQRRSERFAAGVAALSPAALLDGLSESLAGTSLAEHEQFLAACRSYRLELIRYLERKNAFASWRWFTDDRPESLTPWPRFLGLAPEDVSETNAQSLFSRFSDPQVAAQVRRDLEAREHDPSQRLRLDDLPRFHAPSPRLLASLQDGAFEAFVLLALNAAAGALSLSLFRRELLA
ncbi:MAG TPA: ABC transporter permease subunit [Thermoanaerobaculia bacterium]|nr:ABC transporter permease subunit [Thermoanaerobaculia bacterium]